MKTRSARLSWAFVADQAANIALILAPIAAQQGVVPHGWWGFTIFGVLGLIGAMKLTERRRAWSQSERAARGLPPIDPIPRAEDGSPVEQLPSSGSGRTGSGRQG
jgi:hypothetical protein